MAEASTSKRPSARRRTEQVQRRQIAGGVVEEHVFATVVDDEPDGDEMMRHRLGQVVDIFGAGRFDRSHRIRQVVVRQYVTVAIEPREVGAFGTCRMEADLPLEDSSRARLIRQDMCIGRRGTPVDAASSG